MRKSKSQFTIKYRQEDAMRSGIYKIVFGNGIYIGQTACISRRMKDHEQAIKSCLLGNWHFHRSYKHIVWFIEMNLVTEGVATVLEERSDNLTEAEIKWVKAFRWGKATLLNRHFTNKKYHT